MNSCLSLSSDIGSYHNKGTTNEALEGRQPVINLPVPPAFTNKLLRKKLDFDGSILMTVGHIFFLWTILVKDAKHVRCTADDDEAEQEC